MVANLAKSGLLGPVLALIAWSFVMWVWLYATRLPAMRAARMRPDATRAPGTLNTLPDYARFPADNYNHLMEQPTLFYALALTAQVGGATSPLAIGLAWSYVGLRVVHSLIQATINKVAWRFWVFTASTLVLKALLVMVTIKILQS